MHRYRRQARFLAWYDEEGEPSSHNPFKKFRFSRRDSSLENALSQVKSEGDVRTTTECQRRTELNLGRPRRPGTFPIPGSDKTGEADRISEINNLGQSNQSSEPVGIPFSRYEPDEGKPRQRKVLGLFNNSWSSAGTLAPMGSQNSMPVRGKFTFAGQLKATLFNSWINVLLLAVPAGIIINYLHINPIAVFVVNFIAIIPLAAILSYATEEIALRTGETLGGLLNASFGNAVELIVSIIALVHNEILIVQTSLIGSMLSNLLLVLGMCFFIGGINRTEQNFNVVVAQTASSLLALVVGALIIPTAFHSWSNAGDNGIMQLSRGTSVIFLLVYGSYLYFQLKSHSEIYNTPSPKSDKKKRDAGAARGMTSQGLVSIGQMASSVGLQRLELPEEPEEPQLHIYVAGFTLAASTVLVALCAEFMVSAIGSVTSSGGISATFVGLILLPIVGNAAEHATAVTVAAKDKMDLAIGVAVGSSMQISLLVLPLIVVLGWILHNDNMTLFFDGFQITILFVAVLLVNYLIADGKSHWLEGVLLMTLYLIIAIAAWFYPSKTDLST